MVVAEAAFFLRLAPQARNTRASPAAVVAAVGVAAGSIRQRFRRAAGNIELPARCAAGHALAAANTQASACAALHAVLTAGVTAFGPRPKVFMPASAIAALTEGSRAAVVAATVLLVAALLRRAVEANRRHIRAALAARELVGAVLLLRAAGAVIAADFGAQGACPSRTAADHAEAGELPLGWATLERSVVVPHWFRAPAW